MIFPLVGNMIVMAQYLRLILKYQKSAWYFFFILDVNSMFTKFQLSTISQSWVKNV